MKTNIFVNDNSLVDVLVERLARSPKTFKREIIAIDEMYSYLLNEFEDRNPDRTLTYYYTMGRAILDTVQQIINWHFGGFHQVESFLDFACGYGRFTRFLIQELSPDKIWVSDIYKQAVKFQSEYFGVHGIFSASIPEDYQVNQTFDFILASSFFSHMPDQTFERWMKKLYNLKSAQGLLLFSVLDADLLPSHVPMSETGLLFSPASESQSLDKQEYGTTFVTEEYVRRTIDRITDGTAKVTRISKGLNRYQDLYAVSDRSVASSSPLVFYHHPEGKIDYCYIQPNGEVRLSGWAIDFNPGGTVEVQLWSASHLISTYTCSEERPDIVDHYQQPNFLMSGWSCVLSADQISPQDILIIKIVSNQGLEAIIEGDRLVAISTRRNWEIKLSGTRHQLSHTQEQLRTNLEQYQAQNLQAEATIQQYQAECVSYKTQLEHLQSQIQIMSDQVQNLDNRIQAMESSKFWKLRTKWFKLKRVFGLPGE